MTRLRRLCSLLAIAALVAVAPVGTAEAAPTAGAAPPAPGVALVQMATGTPKDFEAAVDAVRALGGDVTLAYPPDAFVATLPPAAATALSETSAVAEIDRGRVDPASARSRGPGAEAAVRAWNATFQGEPDPNVANGRLAPPPPPGKADGLVPPPPSVPRAPNPSGVPNADQTSEFMAGDIVYNVVFVESSGAAGNCGAGDPQTENWDATRQQTVLNKMSEGLSFWTSRANRPSPITFRLNNLGSRNTSCEPINRPGPTDQPLWISDVLTNLGVSATPSNYFDAVRTFDNSQRQALGSDWAFTVFVVDSLNDADGMFSDAYSGYAYLNGPFSVLTYDNGGWGIDRFNKVFEHETGHTFGAEDEYTSSGCTTTATSGYLAVANASCNNGGITTDVSVMGEGGELDATNVDVSTSARSAIGWRNPAPGAGVGSVVDVVRTSTASLTPYTPDPTADTTPIHSATAGNTPFPPGAGHSAVTVSRVTSAARNVDGGTFTTTGVAASDGAFDQESEAYTTTPPALAAGTHTFGTTATNTFGHVSPVATDQLTIGASTACPDASFEPDNSAAQARSVTAPSTEQHAFCVAGDTDWVKLSATAGVTYQIDTLNLAAATDTVLDLLAADGTTVLATNDDNGGAASLITYTASTSGTLYVKARDFSSSSGGVGLTYDLRVGTVCTDSFEPDNTAAQAKVATIDATARHAYCVAGDQDWVKFQAGANSTYKIDTLNLAPGTDTYLDLLAANGTTVLATNDDSGSTLASSITYKTTTTGTLYVRSRHYSSAAGNGGLIYDLKVGKVPGLLLNPGFENDTNADGRPDSWTSNPKFTRSTAVVQAGTYSGRHKATDNLGYTISQTMVNISGGTTYTSSGQVNIPATKDAFTFSVQLRWINGSNATVGPVATIRTYTAQTAGWNGFTGNVTAPAGAVKCEIKMVVTSLNATIYVDRFGFL